MITANSSWVRIYGHNTVEVIFLANNDKEVVFQDSDRSKWVMAKELFLESFRPVN